MSLRTTLAWTAVLLVGPAACGGGASIEEVCEKVASCDDSQTAEQCVEQAEALREQAESAGCEDALDDFVNCANDTFECVEGEVQVDCNSELTEVALCADAITGRECGYGCDADGTCACTVGPNTDQPCCEEGTSCEAALSCDDDCCG